MMKAIRWPVLALAAVLISPWSCPAQSLWERRDPSKVFLFYDTQARSIGDLITIVVSESTDVDNKDERSMEKQTATGGTFDFQGSTSGNAGGSSASASLDSITTSSREFDGRSALTVEQEFSDRITVSVMDVLPNGNLVVGGKRLRFVAGEARKLVVSGSVRPVDIRPDNTVLSQFVADFTVTYDGEGPESRFTNQGWLGRIANKLWPF